MGHKEINPSEEETELQAKANDYFQSSVLKKVTKKISRCDWIDVNSPEEET